MFICKQSAVFSLLDEESVAESSGSRNLPERSVSQTSAIEDGGDGNESQNNGTMTQTRPKKRRKTVV